MKLTTMVNEMSFLLILLLAASVQGLKLLSLDVPTAADISLPVTLRCEYDLEGGNLYSVKWYKDGSEFFRFMPDYDPQSQAVKTSGISVDLRRSDGTKVTLTNLRFNNSGNYKCEVSTEGPNFETVVKSSNMTVMAYPTEDPMIEGVLSTYLVGNVVFANCTSGKSNPPATLTWQINGLKADTRVWEYRKGADETDAQGLHTKTIGLQFDIRDSHFTGKGGGMIPKMEIRCTSTVGDSVRQKSVFTSLARDLTFNKLAQPVRGNTASWALASSLKSLILLITIHQLIFSS